MKRTFTLLLLFFTCFLKSHAQGFGTAQPNDYFIPLNNELNTRYDEWLARKDVPFISTVRPYRADELRKYIPFDSLENNLATHYYPGSGNAQHSWGSRKLFSEHFVDVNDTADEFRLQIDPVFDFEVGRNQQSNQPRSSPAKKTTFNNTRGFQIQGEIGKKFIFYSSFYENQSSFPYFLDSAVRHSGFKAVVPGQGFIKETTEFGTTYFDYALPMGGVSYTLNKHFNFTFAFDKNFLGDGYRSLFLSDNSFAYPFLRITADIWRIRYISINAVMQDAMAPHAENAGFPKKYSTFHYFLLGVGEKNRLTLGLFEAVIWASDTTRGRGYDPAYLNPVLFLDPVQESMDSPDNSLIGFSFRYKVWNSLTLYGQVLLDEFAIGQVRSGKGWWANKQGVQGGLKAFNVAGVKHLSFQSEVNFVRPYTYSHVSTGTNYGQSNQPLADPLGANFIESISFLRYNYQRWGVQAELMAAEIGLDQDSLDYGSNIFESYNLHFQEYGNRILQGLKTTIVHETLTFSYLVNPATNMRVELGIDNRMASNDLGKGNALWVTFGIKTALINKYYDF